MQSRLETLTITSDNYRQELAAVKETLAAEKECHQAQLTEIENRLKNESERKLNTVTAPKYNVIFQISKELEETKRQLNEAAKNLTASQSKLAELDKKYAKLQQVNSNKQKVGSQPPQVAKKITDPGSKLHQQLLELQQVNERMTM